MARTRKSRSRTRRRARSRTYTARTSRVSTSRRRGRRTSRRLLGRWSITDVLYAVGGGVAGFLLTQYVVDKFAPDGWKVGWKRIASKAVVSGAMLFAGKTIGRRTPAIAKLTSNAAYGGMISAGLDTVAKLMVKDGVAGMGSFTTGGNFRTLGSMQREDAELAEYAHSLGIS